MRKRLMTSGGAPAGQDSENWIDLEQVALVELTSEEEAHPIEAALEPGEGRGWRAASSGEQLVRFIFDEPRDLRRIQLVFEEPEMARTQEFVLRWSGESDDHEREIVRQQWNFHSGCTREVGDYRVDLAGVKRLELAIQPDIGGNGGRASVRSLRIA